MRVWLPATCQKAGRGKEKRPSLFDEADFVCFDVSSVLTSKSDDMKVASAPRRNIPSPKSICRSQSGKSVSPTYRVGIDSLSVRLIECFPFNARLSRSPRAVIDGSQSGSEADVRTQLGHLLMAMLAFHSMQSKHFWQCKQNERTNVRYREVMLYKCMPAVVVCASANPIHQCR